MLRRAVGKRPLQHSDRRKWVKFGVHRQAFSSESQVGFEISQRVAEMAASGAANGKSRINGSPPKKLLSEGAYVPGISRNHLIPLAFGEFGPRGARPQARPTAHPIGRRPLAALEQGERRPTGSRAAGLDGAWMLNHCRTSGCDPGCASNFLGREPD